MFGIVEEDGTRVFREVFIVIGRKNGKTLFASAVIAYMASVSYTHLEVYKRQERDGEENVGRVLPAEYCFFTGDGRRNHFTTEWKSTDCFGWTLESPYTD